MKDSLETFLSTLSIWSGRDKNEFTPLKPFLMELMHEPKYAPYLLLNREELESIFLRKPDVRFLFRVIKHEDGWLGISYRKTDGTIMHGSIDLNSFLPDVISLEGLFESLQGFACVSLHSPIPNSSAPPALAPHPSASPNLHAQQPSFHSSPPAHSTAHPCLH